MDRIIFKDYPDTTTPINSSNLNQMQNNIDSAISTNTTNIATIEDNITTIEDNITTVENNVATIESDIATVESDVATIKRNITTIQSNITNINGDITTIEGDVSTINEDITNLETNTTSLTNRVSTLEITRGLPEYGDGYIDCNTTTYHLILSQKNTPNNSLYFVITLFFGGKTATSNRTQIAIPYNYSATNVKNTIYLRYCINNAWTNWYLVANLIS